VCGQVFAIQLAGHLDHRRTEAETAEELLRRDVGGRRTEHEAGNASAGYPGRGRLHQRGRDAGPARRVVDDDVVHEARVVAQLPPRERLDARVDVADDDAVALGDEDRGIRFVKL
jgi:hypothetical protein